MMLRRILNSRCLVSVAGILTENEMSRKPEENQMRKMKDDETSEWDQFLFRFRKLYGGRDSEIGFLSRGEVNKDIRSHEDGWDRFKSQFAAESEHEDLHPSHFIYNLTVLGGVSGFLFGGLREYVKAFNMFMLTSDTTVFMNSRDASVQLSRTGLKAFLKGGIITGIKTGMLLAIFSVTITAVTGYRGRSGLLEYSIAGAVTTAIMKWNLGIRGMLSGFVSGGLTGLLMSPLLYIVFQVNAPLLYKENMRNTTIDAPDTMT